MKIKVLISSSLLLIASNCSAVKKLAVQPVKVEGIAMEPALKHGDRLLIREALLRLSAAI